MQYLGIDSVFKIINYNCVMKNHYKAFKNCNILLKMYIFFTMSEMDVF